jgi:hypothetical protein
MSRNNTSNLTAENTKHILGKLKILYSKMDKSVFLPKAKIYEWDKLDENKLSVAVQIAYHCCVNGPVGVDVATSFPGIEYETSIKNEFNCSNSQWKGFCYIFKSTLSDVDQSQSRSIEVFGEFWPTSDEMKNKNRFRKKVVLNKGEETKL